MQRLFLRDLQYWLSVVASVLLLATSVAAQPLAVARITDVSALQDPSQALDLAAVQSLDNWSSLPNRSLSAGYSHSAWWLRLKVDVPEQATPDNWLAITPTFLDEVQLYLPNALLPSGIVAAAVNPEWKKRTQGDMVPFAARDLNWRGFTFRLNLPAGQHTLYLRVASTSTLMVVPQLFTPTLFAETRVQESLLFGIYFGILLLVLAISLLYWRITRDRLYALYLLVALGTLAYAAAVNGFIAQFILRDSPALASGAVGISVCLSIAAATLFIPHLLELDRVLPWAARLLKTSAALYALTALSVPLGIYSQVIGPIFWLVLFQMALSVYYSYQAWRKGINHARFAIPVYLISLAGFMMPFFAALGLIQSIWAMHAAQISSLLHLVLLHGVMAARVRELDAQRRVALLELEVSAHQVELEQQARHEQRQWISMISHEFKTPLSTIDASIQSIESLVIDNDTKGITSRADKIKRSVGRINSLISSCLQEDQLDHAAASFSPQLIDLTSFISDYQKIRPQPAEAPPLACRFDSTHLNADPRLLALALGNLLDNARQHGGTHISLTSMAMDRHNQAGTAILIEDNGAGVPTTERNRIFEKYTRGSHCRSHGSGFGLWAVRQIMSVHGGEVWLDAPVDEAALQTGARFVMWFPLECAA